MGSDCFSSKFFHTLYFNTLNRSYHIMKSFSMFKKEIPDIKFEGILCKYSSYKLVFK